MLVHYETKGNYFVLLGLGFNLYAYTLPELITQAKKNLQYQFINLNT